jgi:hypothetical protein
LAALGLAAWVLTAVDLRFSDWGGLLLQLARLKVSVAIISVARVLVDKLRDLVDKVHKKGRIGMKTSVKTCSEYSTSKAINLAWILPLFRSSV